MKHRIRTLTGGLGLFAVLTFVIAFFTIGALTPGFHFANDYISNLGSQGQPLSGWWNAIGFGGVGIAFALFGLLFGVCANDLILGVCLLIAGIGFACAAIPTDFSDENSTLSKAHYASICIGLAGWCFGLARLMSSNSKDDVVYKSAKYAIALSVLPIIGIGGGVSAEPMAHRLVMVVVFSWIVFNSVRLLEVDVSPRTAD